MNPCDFDGSCLWEGGLNSFSNQSPYELTFLVGKSDN